MSTKSLLKLFKNFCFVSFFALSCTKTQERAIIVKVGDRSWTFQEIQDYFQVRLNAFSPGKQNLKQLKKEILNEIFLRSLIENWAEQKQIQSKKLFLNEEDKSFFSKYNSRRKALKDHKSYLSLYNLFLKHLFEKTPAPLLKEQKKFYNKNKDLFFEPAVCHLKQILVKEKRMAIALRKRLKQGEAFDKLNQLYSLQQNPGWVKKGDLEVFDTACFKHREALSPVLKSPYGYHIFLIGGKKSKKQKDFNQVQEQVIRILKTNKAKEQFQVWLRGEISKTPIFTDKKLLDKIHIQYKTNEI